MLANGVYKEQVTMKNSLALIGSGMDSCIIDTREFENIYRSILVADSCIFMNFYILKSKSIGPYPLYPYDGYGIDIIVTAYNFNSWAKIENNKIRYCDTGINVGNSSVIIKNNIIIDVSYSGVVLNSPRLEFTPLIESNYINSWKMGIYVFFGSKPTIINNVIELLGGLHGYRGSLSDTVKFCNNLIVKTNTTGVGFVMRYWNQVLP